MTQTAYSRVLLKLSGEVLSGDQSYGIDPSKASELANEIKNVHEMGIGIALVIGAGNIFRGIKAASKGMERVTGDYLGMLATIMNAISIQDALEKLNVQTRTLSAITVSQISEPYIRRRALRHLEKNRVVIVAGGTGNPYFTTDTAAALRASEMNCDAIIKATLVDGVYSADPKKDKNAIKFKNLNYLDVLSKDLKVMDASAISLARENKIPIVVCSINKNKNLTKVLKGEGSFTIISD